MMKKVTSLVRALGVIMKKDRMWQMNTITFGLQPLPSFRPDGTALYGTLKELRRGGAL
jgi:hypothetical protein